MDMFIVSTKPNWVPGVHVVLAKNTLEEAQAWVKRDLGEMASEGVQTTYFIRQVDLGDQLKYSSEIVITASAYPEEEDASE